MLLGHYTVVGYSLSRGGNLASFKGTSLSGPQNIFLSVHDLARRSCVVVPTLFGIELSLLSALVLGVASGFVVDTGTEEGGCILVLSRWIERSALRLAAAGRKIWIQHANNCGFGVTIITMRDYVPKIIGEESFEHYIGPYRGYDPTTDPSTSNVFATAAFRFGHGTISPILQRMNESFQMHEHFPHLRISSTFFSPWRIVKEGGIEPTLRGAIGTPASTASANMLLTEEVTERLIVVNNSQFMDLASLNLQRGRDHGLPGYNDWRSFCGLERIKTLEDLKEVVRDYRVAEKILQLYKNPDNIDVWLGGLVEDTLPGSRTGPLNACLIGKQMKAFRDGDRFWWEADGMFSQQQKDELLNGSLSRIICDNSNIREVPTDSFRFGKFPNDYLSCDHMPSINLEAWREEKSRGGLE
ncbi:hypothetical protein NQZ68_017555 [Dissostichus eleginoides]|nr:hypothetical protein NQZ68_017555 [Dissostichus eleginoides]